MHYTICLKLISSSAQVALPPAFARLEQRGVKGIEMIQDLNLQNRKKRREEAVDEVINNLDYDHRKPTNKEKGQFVL